MKRLCVFATKVRLYFTGFIFLSDILKGSVDKQIDYTDATSIVNAIVNATKQVIRCIPIQYSENYS